MGENFWRRGYGCHESAVGSLVIKATVDVDKSRARVLGIDRLFTILCEVVLLRRSACVVVRRRPNYRLGDLPT